MASNEFRDRLMTPSEVAALFRVDPKTVTRWAKDGRIGRLRTPGGHSRFRESEVRALLASDGIVAPGEPAGTRPAAPEVARTIRT